MRFRWHWLVQHFGFGSNVDEKSLAPITDEGVVDHIEFMDGVYALFKGIPQHIAIRGSRRLLNDIADDERQPPIGYVDGAALPTVGCAANAVIEDMILFGPAFDIVPDDRMMDKTVSNRELADTIDIEIMD